MEEQRNLSSSLILIEYSQPMNSNTDIISMASEVMMTGKHKNYLGVGEVVKTHHCVRVAEADIIFWTTTGTLGISLISRQMYIQKVTDSFTPFFFPAC